MQERVQELELKYQKYLRKRLLRRLFLGILGLCLGLGFYWSFEFYTQERALNAKLLEEKRLLQTKMAEAKIKQEKIKLHKEKLEQEKQISTFKGQNPITKISIESSVFDLSSLKKSYYQNPSFEKALLLSRLYLENKDYKKSIFWSLKANEWDKGARESWQLFARAKAGLGEKEQEGEILRLYTHYYENMEPQQ